MASGCSASGGRTTKTIRFLKADGDIIEFKKFNPYHDRLGRFASANGATGGFSQTAEESDIADAARRAAKSLATGQKVMGFKDLPKDYQRQFRAALAKAAPEAKTILRREYRSADYIMQEGLRSYYSRGFGRDIITLGTNADASTLAYELFHKLDKGHKISGPLAESLNQDKTALEKASQGQIKAYLLRRYPEAFVQDRASQDVTMKREYRGIADILNGISQGKERYGYGHPKSYWQESNALAKEAWAQFGRIQFDNHPDVIKLAEELFPKFSEDAIIALKELM